MINGDKVKLVPMTPQGLVAMQGWSEDPETMKFLQCAPHQMRGEWLEEWRRDPRRRALSLENAAGALIGIIELEELTWRNRSVELRICIGVPEFRGKGYGFEAISSLLNHLFGVWKLKVVYLRVEADNAPAIRCYEKCGFVKKGRVMRRSGEPGDNEEVELIFMEASAIRWAKLLALGA